MKREEILAMPAGRELDALVAEKVMGWVVYRGETPNHYDLLDEEYAHGFPPNEDVDGVPFEIEFYSTDISAAWEVQEIMQEWGGMELGCYGSRNGTRWYTVKTIGPNEKETKITCNTAPEAICKAALIAVMEVSHDL